MVVGKAKSLGMPVPVVPVMSDIVPVIRDPGVVSEDLAQSVIDTTALAVVDVMVVEVVEDIKSGAGN
jgi:hypothetical protein